MVVGNRREARPLQRLQDALLTQAAVVLVGDGICQVATDTAVEQVGMLVQVEYCGAQRLITTTPAGSSQSHVDRTPVRFFKTSHNAQQRCFSGAIRTGQHSAFAADQLNVDADESGASAKTFVDVVEVKFQWGMRHAGCPPPRR